MHLKSIIKAHATNMDRDIRANGPKNSSSAIQNDSYFKVRYDNIVDRIGINVFLPSIEGSCLLFV